MENDCFEIRVGLDKTAAVKALNDRILFGRKSGFTKFVLLVKNSSTYSNVCAPLAGVLDHYRSEGLDFTIEYEDSHSYSNHTSFDQPRDVNDYLGTVELNYPLDKVWKFNSSETVNELINSYILTIRQSDIVERGVLSGIEWGLNEAMDNVLQHSSADCGYVMAQLHKTTKMFSVCIFDTGRGIYNSLKNSKHNPTTPLDAITLAMQEKVTRDESIGQGNGLWGLSNMVSEAKGSLKISSSGAVYKRNNDNVTTIFCGDFNLGKEHGTTLIDFQFNYCNSIDIAKTLNGHMPTDLWIENLEAENGDVVFPVREMSSGTGTRIAAEKFRNMMLNVAINESKNVILDFNGVNLVSSSYADELIGKTVGEYGFLFFMQRIRLENVTPFNVSVINRSVQQRMAQKYYDIQIVDDE